ncbi:hypothetical protein TSAR_016819 [Trichomalopsis sarcophagae]|uniref:Uncharacterized protein n=1 Tax=Trichomalopsis sarcophagae TaxID=543379 RepID=A0A232ESA8_9HYME|nr:hypothetical protein TSAR_016819 [Trichomalopsis sarcophagae]
MLIGLPRSLASKFHNYVNRYRDFKIPGADPRSAFLRSDLLTHWRLQLILGEAAVFASVSVWSVPNSSNTLGAC